MVDGGVAIMVTSSLRDDTVAEAPSKHSLELYSIVHKRPNYPLQLFGTVQADELSEGLITPMNLSLL